MCCIVCSILAQLTVSVRVLHMVELCTPPTSKVQKDEAVQPPTIAIIVRFFKVVLIILLRSTCATYMSQAKRCREHEPYY
jgi:hypothetical protein